MRFAVFAALVGLAIASSRHWSTDLNEERFRSGKEFRYRFDGQLSAGIPVPNSQNAVTRIQSLITLQPESDGNVRLQLSKIRFAAVQDELKTLSVTPIEHMDNINIDEEQERVLSLPIRFNYKYGLVSEIEFHQNEQTWSVNIKKAVVNMLQINLLKKGVSESRDVLITENDNYFLAVERMLEGECEVAYTKVDETSEIQQWTKAVNFEKCTVRPETRYGRQFVEKCEECEMTINENKLSSTVMTFNVSGTPEDFLIREVELKSQMLFAPIGKQEQIISALVFNKMVLVYSGDITSKIMFERSSRTENLIYNNEVEIAEEMFIMTGEEKHLRLLPKMFNKVEIIQKLLLKIAKHVESEIELETSHTFARIVKVLRICTESEINKIHNFLYETKEMEKKTFEKVLGMYIDALAVAGTKVTISHLVMKINRGQVTLLKAAQLMKVLAEIRIPSEQIAEDIFMLCESDVSTKNSFFRQSCMLTYGSILNGLCGDNLDKLAIETEKLNTCSRSLKEKLVRQLINKFEHFETRYEKVLVLKTLANAGIDMSVFELEKIILDKSIEGVVRVQAIEALRRLRTVMPRKIQNILMPIYQSRTELPEIRMSALHLILQTQPKQNLIEQIVRVLEKERSHQVRTFTFSTLKSLSESTVACEKVLALRIRNALLLISEVERTMLDSRFNAYTLYNNKFQTGVALNWASIFTNDSMLPKEMMTSLETVFGGEWNKYFAQVGFTQNNLDGILSRLVRKMEETSIDQLVVRGKRSAMFNPTELLRSLVEKLQITRREVSKEEAHALLYFRYKDMDYAFLPIDIDTIPKMIKSAVRDGKIDLGDIERMLVKGTHFTTSGAVFVHETTRTVVTALGLPLVLSSKMPTVASLNGHIKVDFEPRNSETFTGLRLRLVAKPQLASTNVIKIEIISPIVSSGVKILQAAKIHTPVDTELIVNWEKKLTVKTVVKALENKKHVVHFMTRPLTFVRVWKNTYRHYPESAEQTIYLKESLYPIHTVEREYFENLGVKVLVSGHLRRSPLLAHTEYPSALLVTDNVIDVVLQPTSELVKEYVLNMEIEAFVPVDRMEKPSLNFLNKKSSGDYFEVEDSDYKSEDETERRETFSTYMKNIKIDKAYKHRVFFKFETVGDRVNMEAETELEAVCDDKIRYCRLNIEARRSPMLEETRQWELKALFQTLYPEMPTTLRKMYEQLHREFVGLMEAKWGSDKLNTLTLNLQGGQSRHQKVWMKRIEREQNELSEFEKLMEASMLNQYKLVADYDLTPVSMYHVEQMYSLLKTWNMWNTDIEMMNKRDSRVEATLTIEPVTRLSFNLTIETPKERVLLREIVMPFTLPTINIRRHFGSVHTIKHVFEKIEEKTRSECVVKSKEVQTFDKLFFRAPLTTCYSVLAKDCSSETPDFAVLMKKITNDSEEKKIKIITRENVIEIERVDDKVLVFVNGKRVESEKTMEMYGILRKSENLYKIEIDNVVVFFDGFEAKLKMSSLYKNKQCGVCGHFDGEKMNEFRRADNIETTDIEEFHRSYLSRDNECKMEETVLSKKTNYKIISEETSSSEEYDYSEKMTKPVLRTRVLERGQRLCFSVEPINECSSETREEETIYEQTTFKCLRRTHAMAHRLLRLARREVLSNSDLSSIDETFEHKIRVPKMCSVY